MSKRIIDVSPSPNQSEVDQRRYALVTLPLAQEGREQRQEAFSIIFHQSTQIITNLNKQLLNNNQQ